MQRLFTEPTPSDEWVRAGDLCYSQMGMCGIVLRVIRHASLPSVRVLWENGHEGLSSITTIRRTDGANPEGQMNAAFDVLVERFLARDFDNDGRLDNLAGLRGDLMAEQRAVRERVAWLRSVAMEG